MFFQKKSFILVEKERNKILFSLLYLTFNDLYFYLKMTEIKTSNAITRRIDLMQTYWEKFIYTKNAFFCCWLVKQDEVSMVDAFYQVNADESSDTPDIFLRFEAPFEGINSYSKSISEELAEIVEADRDLLAEDDIFLDWAPNYKADPKNSAVGFLREFFHFAHSLELEEGKVIAYLSPSNINNPSAWKKWWQDALSLDLPDKIALMVCETKERELLANLSSSFPKKMMVFSPELDMDNAIRELMNEYGDQEDNCTHFRKAFFELTQAVAKGNVNGIQQKAKNALGLARQIGFPYLEIAVLCTVGNGFMMNGKEKSGILAFDEALKIADASKDKPLVPELPNLVIDLPGGNLFEQLAVQTLFFKAAGFLALKKPSYEQALGSYQQADKRLVQMLLQKKPSDKQIDWTNGGIIHFHQLEALRMIGFCSEKLGRQQTALKVYSKAITTAEKMPLEMRQNTTLPFIAQALLNIYYQQSMKKEYWALQKKMNDLLGENWDKQLPKAA